MSRVFPALILPLITIGLLASAGCIASEERTNADAYTAECSAADIAKFEDRKPPEGSPWIALEDYPRPPAPDTGWGIHDHTNGDWFPPDQDAFYEELRGKYGFTWFKILGLGKNKIGMTAAARRHGVEPVVRIYDLAEYPQPGPEEEKYRDWIRAYVEAGGRYFELANEPNIDGEWTAGGTVENDRIEGICRTWLRVKRIAQEEGAIPIFYAMTPGSAGEYYRDCFETFKSWGKIEEAFAGAAIGIHPYPLNHPLEYPFDPLSNLPHATRAERFNSLMQDNSAFRILELVQMMQMEYLPYAIPILATEAGYNIGDQSDHRYPEITPERMAELNMEIFNRMDPDHPLYWGDSFFSHMVWAYGGTGSFMFSGWFNNPKYGGNLPVLDRMEEAEKFDRGEAFE